MPGRQPGETFQDPASPAPARNRWLPFAGQSQVWRRGSRARRGTCRGHSRGRPSDGRDATPRRRGRGRVLDDGVCPAWLETGAQGTASTPHETCPEICPELDSSDLRRGSYAWKRSSVSSAQPARRCSYGRAPPDGLRSNVRPTDSIRQCGPGAAALTAARQASPRPESSALRFLCRDQVVPSKSSDRWHPVLARSLKPPMEPKGRRVVEQRASEEGEWPVAHGRPSYRLHTS